MDETDRGIEIPDDLAAFLIEQAEANQRTPVEELRAILIDAIEDAPATPPPPDPETGS